MKVEEKMKPPHSAPFIFATDFVELEAAEKAAAEAAAALSVSPETLAAECERSRTEGYAAGHRDGETAAAKSLEAALHELMLRLSGDLDALAQQQSALAHKIKHDAARLALLIGQKLGGVLLARLPGDKVFSVIEDAISTVPSDLDIKIRVHTRLAGAVKQRFAGSEGDRSNGSRIVIVPDATLHPADCRVDWADGGISTDTAALESKIEKAVSDYLAAPDGATPPPSQASDKDTES